ncbi:hypothetical protein GCM10010174_32190 [Kutzneria viridogrisea]|uniref:ATP-binding protein n=1 Tax=Kutzneria viridogrisea TaxID=47990 RepID=A0ABR6BQI6_9PSEU|nr:hypothetical protein [Kutzneria viridogrisea]
MAELYGRAGVERLIAECLRRDRASLGRRRGADLPVVTLVGPRGSGKTAFLAHLHEDCRGRLPVVRVDLDGVAERPTRKIISELAFELSAKCGQFGQIAFPHLALCLLMVGSALPLNSRSQAIRMVNELLRKQDPLERSADEIEELLRLVTATGVPSWTGSVLKLLWGGLGWVSRRRRLTFGARLSKEASAAPPGPYGALLDMIKWHAHGADQELDDMFCTAFLLDMRRAYRGLWRSGQRTTNCLVLLDNVDSVSGRKLLATLMRASRDPEMPDPFLVVCTSRSWLREWDSHWHSPSASARKRGRAVRTPEQATLADWSPAGRGRDARWYLVAARDLSLDEVGDLLTADRRDTVQDEEDARVVHRLTGGLPWAVTRLSAAMAETDRDEVSLRAAFAELVPVARRELLYGLTAEQQRLLINTSATPTVERGGATEDLGADRPGAPGDPYGLLGNRLLLAENGTGMHPWMRRVLLHELTRLNRGRANSWESVHRRQCTRASQLVHVNYHRLALGEFKEVVQHLERVFTHESDEQWLTQLDAITAAPNALPQDRSAFDQAAALVRESGVDPATGWLVASLWINADPLGDPRRTLWQEIESGYRDLAKRHNWSRVLLDRAEEYRR